LAEDFQPRVLDFIGIRGVQAGGLQGCRAGILPGRQPLKSGPPADKGTCAATRPVRAKPQTGGVALDLAPSQRRSLPHDGFYNLRQIRYPSVDQGPRGFDCLRVELRDSRFVQADDLGNLSQRQFLQIMRSERESGDGSLGTGDDATGESAIDFAEQQLASLLSRQLVWAWRGSFPWHSNPAGVNIRGSSAAPSRFGYARVGDLRTKERIP
jgi:hypothetical protein